MKKLQNFNSVKAGKILMKYTQPITENTPAAELAEQMFDDYLNLTEEELDNQLKQDILT